MTLASTLAFSNMAHCDSHAGNIMIGSLEVANTRFEVEKMISESHNLKRIIYASRETMQPPFISGSVPETYFPSSYAHSVLIDPEKMFYIDLTFGIDIRNYLKNNETKGALPCMTISSCRREDPWELFRMFGSMRLNEVTKLATQ